MPLALVLGPANCGKIGYLQERFLAFVDAGSDPFLIVPNRPDVEAFEHDVLRRRGALLGGRVGTFDALFDDVLERCGDHTNTLADVQRRLIFRRLAASAELDQVAVSARFAGFADALAGMADELAAGMIDPPKGPAARLSCTDWCAPTEPSATGSAWAATGWGRVPGRRSCWSGGWKPGTSVRCLPTDSRI